MNTTYDISNAYVTDECIDEWDDYAKCVQEEIQETSEILNDENRQYILKEDNNIIKIYYINEKNEEVLFRVTDISTQYLEDEDIQKLKEGIKVIGIKKLNQILEDFE